MAAIRIWVSPTSVAVHHQKKHAPAPVLKKSSSTTTSTTTTTTTTTTRRRTTMIVAQSTTTPADHISLQSTTPLLQIRSSIKVFEDGSSGIVCYRDDKGEITCEGYDEGPRFHQKTVSRLFTSIHKRDAEVIDLLETRLLQIVDDNDHHAKPTR